MQGSKLAMLTYRSFSSHSMEKSMPVVISKDIYVVFVEWEVDPKHQRIFIDSVADLVEQSFRSYKGFVSASFHRSEDGTRVVNYAQWQSKQDWQKAFTAPGREQVTAAIFAVIKQCDAKPVITEGFHVERIVLANHASSDLI
jgi:quinol monooxygenase YgiN